MNIAVKILNENPRYFTSISAKSKWPHPGAKVKSVAIKLNHSLIMKKTVGKSPQSAQ